MILNSILTPSTVRHFPNAALPEKKLSTVDIALNERFSFQVALRADEMMRVRVTLEGPDGWELRTRHVGLALAKHHNTPILSDPLDQDGIGQIPGLVPDPLLEENDIRLAQDETTAFWFTVRPSKKVTAGKYDLTATVTILQEDTKTGEIIGVIGKPKKHKLSVRVHNIAIKPRKNFDITHWFYNDCLITWYKTNGFDDNFWAICENYIKDIADHGQNVIYVPIFTPPLDGDKYPSQLLKVKKCADGKYEFDWTDVRRYVKLAKKCGIDTFEWCHLFAQWGCRFALRIYEGQGEGEKVLWDRETPATSEIYRNFLSQFLPELEKFLKEEKIFKKSFFHISDEPHGEEARKNYIAAKEMVREIAPWLRSIDAVSEIEYAEVIDTPVPITSSALKFLEAGFESWVYYCCGPRSEYIQHLMDTPLAKIAMHGFLFYRWPFKGFLHWGYNYWNISGSRTLIDPFIVTDGMRWPNWAYGDTFLVYPGEKGPIDSIRWEIFSESLQDFALLQTLGIDRDDKLLSQIKSFKDFPKDAKWRNSVRAKLFALVK